MHYDQGQTLEGASLGIFDVIHELLEHVILRAQNSNGPNKYRSIKTP